ncbi:MAG TPA: S-adenosylmethionine:tRNA ribosyltransferase-isomerase [Bacteroidales bacterium]|nr:S-adenosylmethionine:tRNA ribosyltransferase-isomerase [Bacteroidales bacterium]
MLQKIQSIRIEDFAYNLPDERIAKFPVEPRDASKLLLYQKGTLSETTFGNLPEHLESNSLLVYNNTRVIHARLFFFKETGARIEVFCLEPLSPADYAQNFQSTEQCEWLCLVGNLKKWKLEPLHRELVIKDSKILFSAERVGTEDKAQRIRFSWKSLEGPTLNFGDLLEEAGQLPIPPYLNRETQASDETTYQTVFSRIEGSVAAPTAGLHFTPEVLKNIDEKGIVRSEVTLHVGAGTFQPVLSEFMLNHTMHSEFISVEKEFLQALISHLGSVTAVGTTSVRTLESLYWFGYRLLAHPDRHPDEWTLDQWYAYRQMTEWQKESEIRPIPTIEALEAIMSYLEKNNLPVFTASTRLLIAPGYRFHVVNAMLTNFHQPNSTLLLLVSAFLGGDNWRTVYNYALQHNFRFLSYGDSSLLVPVV